MSGLGRRAPTSWEHVEKYALTADTAPSEPTPVAIGINWYTNFDTPHRFKKERYYIGGGPLGSVRGGHCVCLEPGGKHRDHVYAWWDFYDQGAEGACVGFGCSRMMSLLNRKRYDARWLWDMAKQTDEWPDTNPGDDNGTSVHAAAAILAQRGHVAWRKGFEGREYRQRDTEQPQAQEGISVYRWATSAQQVLDVLQNPTGSKLGAVCILNSWGRSYPHRVWMPAETLDRLLSEDGEAVLPVDR
jgi:hypothetical protein